MCFICKRNATNTWTLVCLCLYFRQPKREKKEKEKENWMNRIRSRLLLMLKVEIDLFHTVWNWLGSLLFRAMCTRGVHTHIHIHTPHTKGHRVRKTMMSAKCTLSHNVRHELWGQQCYNFKWKYVHLILKNFVALNVQKEILFLFFAHSHSFLFLFCFCSLPFPFFCCSYFFVAIHTSHPIYLFMVGKQRGRLIRLFRVIFLPVG